MPYARLWLPAVLVVVPAVAIGLVWGGDAAIVYAFFAGIAALMAVAVGVGGDWTRDVSRGRFARRDDRDR
jgi:hypothetical protein